MSPRRLIPVLAAVAVALVVATTIVMLSRLGSDGSEGTEASGGADGTERSSGTPSAILAGWDRRRAQAWAEGDTDALAALYSPDSAAGDADVRLLRRYTDRGLRVEDLRTQVLELHVTQQSPDRLVMVVTDRLAGGTAVGGASPVPLPADRASTRRIVMVRSEGEWLVASATDQPSSNQASSNQPSAAASTSRTSSSSKS